MCGLQCAPSGKKELGIEEIRTVARHLSELGSRHLVITGGEPFLRPDLPHIVAAFAEHNFMVRIQTNGGAPGTEELLRECVHAGLTDVSVSIDTLDHVLQDEICRASNVVENAIRALSLASDLLPNSITLANVVASKLNFQQLPALVRFFHEMGVYTYITPVMISSALTMEDYRFRGSDSEFSPWPIAPEIRDRVIHELRDLRRCGLGLTNSIQFLEDWRRYLTGGHSDWTCDAGRLSLDVFPGGSVGICEEKPPLENLMDPEFVQRYRGGHFHDTTAAIIRDCTGCFYGEYREPYYAAYDLSAFIQWCRDWILFFRRGVGTNHRSRSGSLGRT